MTDLNQYHQQLFCPNCQASLLLDASIDIVRCIIVCVSIYGIAGTHQVYYAEDGRGLARRVGVMGDRE